MQCGLVGLPNAGKSTIFHALSAAPAEIANYPFCTIEPNIGIAKVNDARLQHLAEIFNPPRAIPTTVKFFDIAGLVAGASQGEGLGNRFLAHIRECNAIAHVLRCFEDGEVTHVNATIDPAADFETITTELSLADIESVERRREANKKMARVTDAKKRARAEEENRWLDEVLRRLSADAYAAYDDLEEGCREFIQNELFLLTAKTQLIVCNIDEDSLGKSNRHAAAIRARFGAQFQIVEFCGKLEAELADIEDESERALFVEECGIKHDGLTELISSAYRALNFCTFFTAGKNEVRAWTYPCGSAIAAAAATIHTDFERNFIKAEVYPYATLRAHGSEQALRQAGLIRTEGREYIVQDGDVIFIHAR